MTSYADLGRRLWRKGTRNDWGGVHGPACRCFACADLRASLPAVYARSRVRTYTDEHGWHVGASRLGIPYEEYRTRVLDGQRYCYGHKTWESRLKFGVSRRERDGRARACSEYLAERSQAWRDQRRAS